MNIMSFNIVRGENFSKRKRIQQILQKGKVDMCCLHETKIQVMNDVVKLVCRETKMLIGMQKDFKECQKA